MKAIQLWSGHRKRQMVWRRTFFHWELVGGLGQRGSTSGVGMREKRTIGVLKSLRGKKEGVTNGGSELQRALLRSDRPDYYSISELAERWRVSRGTVYNRLRSAGAKVLDFAAAGRRSKKAIHVSVVFQIETQRTKRLC